MPSVGASCDLQRSNRSRDTPPSPEVSGPPPGDGGSPGTEEPPERVGEGISPFMPDGVGCEEDRPSPEGKPLVELPSPAFADLG
jgi:hypothetical protein